MYEMHSTLNIQLFGVGTKHGSVKTTSFAPQRALT